MNIELFVTKNEYGFSPFDYAEGYIEEAELETEFGKTELETKLKTFLHNYFQKFKAETKRIQTETEKIEAETKRIQAETKEFQAEAERLQKQSICLGGMMVVALGVMALSNFMSEDPTYSWK